MNVENFEILCGINFSNKYNWNCSECDEYQKRIRHCPYIPKEQHIGVVAYPIVVGKNKTKTLTECPVAFVNKHYDEFALILDIKSCVEAQVPFHSKIGLLELPNPIVTLVYKAMKIHSAIRDIELESRHGRA